MFVYRVGAGLNIMQAPEGKQTQHEIRVGTSSCLLGEEVRYDGGHKRNVYILKSLANHFQLVPFCPEMGAGLGTPRPPVRLVKTDVGLRARGVSDANLDVTDALQAFSDRIVSQLNDLSGYIFKKGSPSCGMERVKIYTEAGMPVESGSGIFAATVMQQLPLLPVEEEGRLMDPVLRENFIERVFVYHRWQELLRQGLTPASLVEFHTDHKFTLLAHDEPAYREMGRIVADAGTTDLQAKAEEYAGMMMKALKKIATRKQHTNVLTHIMGFLKTHIDSEDKQELLEVLERYRLGLLPLIVPITLLKHHLRRYPQEYIQRQHYMNPHPDELMLRNSL